MNARGVALLVAVAAASAAGNAQTSAPAGNAARGKALYEQTYRCYACHGYAGQTGLPRIVPQARSRDAFVAYLRKPRTPGMPKYVDVSEQDLGDVYAYVRSLAVDAVPVASIPLLTDILQRRAQAK